ncbi:MAG TPA: alpha/beta hydrolase [Solirubrobacterales bacterium]
MAELPRLSVAAEHRLLRAVCGLSPRVQKRLFGPPPSVDGQTLASDIHALISLAKSAGTHSFTNGLPPREARAFNRRGAAAATARPPLPMERVRGLQIPGQGGSIPVRHYRPLGLPADQPAPLLVYYHGGGWVIGDLDTHDGVCRFLATVAGVQVLSVGYRLAPEHPFPAPVEDAWSGFAWAVENAASLGADPARIAVGGDSAGGNMAAVVSLLAREGGGARPAMQLLIYPVTDPAEEMPSRLLFADGFMLTKADMDYFEGMYLPPGTDRDDPRISIFEAPNLADLAPAYVTTAGFDPLRDEGEAFALRLRDAGNRVALRRHPGLIHGFANQTAFSRNSLAAMHEVAGALRMGIAAPALAAAV